MQYSAPKVYFILHNSKKYSVIKRTSDYNIQLFFKPISLTMASIDQPYSSCHKIYTMSQIKQSQLYFYDIFYKCGPI